MVPAMRSRRAAPSGTDGQPDHLAEPGPFDFDFDFEFFLPQSLPSPPAMCAADEVFLAGNVLPFRDALPGRADRAGVLCCQGGISGAGVEGSKLRRRLWGASRVKPEYRRLRRMTNCEAAKGLLPTSETVARRRPKWYYLCVLGSVWVPATTDISEIRSRQRRQSAAAELGGVQPSSDVGKGTWKLLQSMSCSGLESASNVTAPSALAVNVKGA